MNKIIPGILEKDWTEIEAKLDKIKSFSDTVHIDVIDGKFSPNLTFIDPQPFSKYANEIFMEVHLMTLDPLKFLDTFASAGFKRFLGHVEQMPDIAEFVARGQMLGEVGLAFDIDTKLESIEINYDDLDVILLLAAKAGESGQALNPEIFEKIKNLRSKTLIPIEVDCGINDQTVSQLKDVGAQRFVSTSYLFEGDTMQNWQKLHSALDIK